MRSSDLFNLINARNFKGTVSINDISLFYIPPIDDYYLYLVKIDEVVSFTVIVKFETAYVINLACKYVAVPNIIADLLSISFNVVLVESNYIKDIKFLLAGQIYLLNMIEYIREKSPDEMQHCLFDKSWANTLLVLRDFYIIRMPTCSKWFV